MSTTDDALEALTDDLVDGAEERQIGDRRVKKMDPVKRLEAIDRLAASSVTTGCKIKFGFK